MENPILSSLPSMSRTGSTVYQGDVTDFLQCLRFDPKSMATEYKFNRHEDFRQLASAAFGLQDGSLKGEPPSFLPEGIERLRAGLRESTIKGRERVKIFSEILSVASKCFPSIPSIKRSRPNSLSGNLNVMGGGVGKMGTPNHASASVFDFELQKVEERGEPNVPNKRTRTSMVDQRADVCPITPARSAAGVDRDPSMSRTGSTVSQGDVTDFLQYLWFDPKSMATEYKFNRHGDFRQLASAAFGLQDGSLKGKPLSFLPEGIAQLRAGLRESIIKSRERVKIFSEILSVASKCFPSIPSRKRSHPNSLSGNLNVMGGGVGKMVTPNHASASVFDFELQKVEERGKHNVPNKRTRTSMVDQRADVCPITPARSAAGVDRDKEVLRMTDSNGLQGEDRSFPIVHDGWEKPKMKKKRSIIKADNASSPSSGSTKPIDGYRVSKEGIHPRHIPDGRSRETDSYGSSGAHKKGMSFLEELESLRMPFPDIKEATKNFTTLIGKGGYGLVYRGELLLLGKLTCVAVKRLDGNVSGQGFKEFLTEIQMLTRYKHPNLVSLIGFCDQDNEKILIYEHAEHGSLDKYLTTAENRSLLTWKRRINICVNAARGLNFLHNEVAPNERVIHRDIKSANVLLDRNWKAMISDLGLSKLGRANEQDTFLITNASGTHGYCDPVYISSGILTKESDVYSFGVVLFEVLCGRLGFINVNSEHRFLSSLAQSYYKKGKIDEIMDPVLKNQMDSDSLDKFSKIASQCLLKNRKRRPSMYTVVKKLEELEKAVESQQ